MSGLNYFEPRRRPTYDRHEDDLTRAYLVLIRLIPLVVADFLEGVRARQREAGYRDNQLLPRLSETEAEVEVATQTSAIDAERNWLVSVLVTDEGMPVDEELTSREQDARYDGVLTLGDYVVTIENKPRHRDVWADQLNPDLPVKGTLTVPEGARPVVLPWKELIGAVASLATQNHLSPTAARVVDDFRNYLLRHWEFLNPYPTFRACGDSNWLLNRRSGEILKEIGGNARVDQYQNGPFRLRIANSEDSDQPSRYVILRPEPLDGAEVRYIKASSKPGDTVSQARSFYHDLDRDGLLNLIEEEPDWGASTNLHLNYWDEHVIHSSVESDLSTLDDYLTYWGTYSDRIRQVDGMDAMRQEVQRLHTDGWLTGEDVEEFEQKYGQTNRDYVRICPGLTVFTRWPIHEAREVDDGEETFVRGVKERYERMLSLWNQTLPTRNGR